MKVNVTCVHRGECRRYCVFYKATCKFCGNFYVVNTQNTLKIMKPHFQDVAQEAMNHKNSDPFSAHFTKKFKQKPSPQQCHKIMSFGILSTVNYIGSMKTRGKSFCTLCMKERIYIIDNS